MPFRHLLFNRRNGAPQRNPDQQPISLDQAAFFSLDDEFPAYNRWPDQTPPSPVAYNAMMQKPSAMKQQQSSVNESFDQRSMFPYHSMNGVPYQKSPYDFDSSSLQYSSDMMDTDVSSISRGSIHSSMSSVSHLDVMLDEEVDSVHSLSRKPSVTSNFDPGERPEQLCPLITGQVGKCSPELCGPTAPCLQYVNDDVVPPIEECIPDNIISSSANQMDTRPIDFITPHHSPQRQRQQVVNSRTKPDMGHAQPSQVTITETDKKSRARGRPPANKGTNSSSEVKDETPVGKQAKKSRARQAHSLVERKYRENLNAKIQELHQTLQRVQSGKSGVQCTASHSRTDDEDGENDDMDRASLRVKKSDVLIEAMNYVHTTELEMRRKDEEIQKLNDRIKLMESWIQNGAIDHRGLI